MQLTDDIMYQAILDKNAEFTGLFYTAVKTTGIFCRPTCTARKPKRENVVFYTSSSEAIRDGFRACKVCRPMELPDETPPLIRDLLDKLSEDPSAKFRDHDLRQRGLEPHALRRWFLKHHGITFHAYQRMHRINSAFKKISSGAPVTGIAFDAGYDSLSGFGDSFKSVFGYAPSESRQKQVIDIKRIETPLGTMLACAVKDGICLLEFSDRKMLETELKDLSRIFNATIIQGQNPHFPLLEKELQAYFSGKLTEFTVPLHTPGTSFQQAVWNELRAIPFAATRSYKEMAGAVGKPDAVRALANANGMNRVAIIVPCHRVIGSDGSLTGYAGGIWRKQWLLNHESSVLANSHTASTI
ncbi:bifunctional transcriptional activator/DNA repair enzyme AdaA [Flavihumibacter sp. ZG627]|uniref:bifunctional transcriptional activator/DNA repair enzyme AdaA n=1 Tax=Flavihumibacter sp. ZG627 TaxID=1463156 RepID=UPI00057E56A0|nr:methylated-DNA--[protein]-cysteine S-methyltransferase [Flavihumibacter sp. ZG627]KIC92236.1 XRE family transcriptional regulator [Flavihumibacter sp. ZG627]